MRLSEALREQVRADANDGSAAGRTLTLRRFAQLGGSPGVHVATATAFDFVSDDIAPGRYECFGRGGVCDIGQRESSSWGVAQGGIIFEEPAD